MPLSLAFTSSWSSSLTDTRNLGLLSGIRKLTFFVLTGAFRRIKSPTGIARVSLLAAFVEQEAKLVSSVGIEACPSNYGVPTITILLET